MGLFSCQEQRCNESHFEDDFDDSIISALGYKKSTIYQIEPDDTLKYAEFYFDDYGRTDSVIYYTDHPEGIIIQTVEFSGDSHSPEGMRKYLIKSGNGEVELLLDVYSVGNEEVEVHFENGDLVYFDRFINNDQGLNKVRRRFAKDSILEFSIYHEYNQQGQIIKSYKYNEDSLLVSRKVSEYNYSNVVATTEKAYVNNQLYIEVERAFKDCFNISLEREINHSTGEESAVFYEFNGDNLPESYRIEGYEDIRETIWVFTYEL